VFLIHKYNMNIKENRRSAYILPETQEGSSEYRRTPDPEMR